MIVSASYRTDIPTFYGAWFMNRLRAGYCKMANPYNRRISHVDLTPAAVDGFVFWTKNVGPFLPALFEVRERGYPFIVQYGVNNYPRALEFSVVDASQSVEQMHRLRAAFGAKVAVWRYDTILITSSTPIEFHRRNFTELARQLEGATDEVVVSFAQIYQKTRRNLDWAARRFDFTWEDPATEAKYALAAELAAIAKTHGMQLAMCAQKEFLAPGVVEARCIDARRLASIAGKPIDASLKGNRPECGCFLSRDIGEYDTCPHGCVYCYAVQNRALAQRRYRAHDPNGEFLFPPVAIDAAKMPNDEEPAPVQKPLWSDS